MPELRQEPITGNWVIIATERNKRPSDFQARHEERKGGVCPFCKGNEKLTPPEITAYREAGTHPDEPGWWIRVVPNKFAALDNKSTDSEISRNFYTSMNGNGAHEVIIESPEHDQSIEQHDPVQMQEIFRAWRDRLRALMARTPIRYVQIFKNAGAIAGASLEHPHSQVIAAPLIPTVIENELEGARAFFVDRGLCPYCEMIAHEEAAGDRLIAGNQQFIAFCPYASRFPFEITILPRRHQADFSGLDDSMLQDLSAIVKVTMQKLTASLSRPPYNLMLHTAPAGFTGAPYYHWRLEILPRLTIVAGFEWGTGIYINPTPPETAAKYLRETAI
ncbi:MAG: galactose-1-phosphate uridylyltransferase [Thermacetogeniaceae bacterium]|jgi:UDPglucose--hexose-1-phosphate uridylyltransferase